MCGLTGRLGSEVSWQLQSNGLWEGVKTVLERVIGIYIHHTREILLTTHPATHISYLIRWIIFLQSAHLIISCNSCISAACSFSHVFLTLQGFPISLANVRQFTSGVAATSVATAYLFLLPHEHLLRSRGNNHRDPFPLF